MCYIAQSALKRTILLSLPPNAVITDVCHHAWPFPIISKEIFIKENTYLNSAEIQT